MNLINRILRKSEPLGYRNDGFDWILDLPDEDFIRLAYVAALCRKATDTEVESHLTRIHGYKMERWSVFRNLAESPEFIKTQNPFHFIRLELMQKLPPAEVIVDLGGSTPHSPEGALYLMGYRPKARRLLIVDLPPAERFEEWKKNPDLEPLIVEHETGRVEYVYGSIADLSMIRESNFADMIWSGNAIEHVSEQEGDTMIAGAYRLLKPGGWFCLDTPNREVTELIYQQNFCHPDHKCEYTGEALSRKLEAQGFVIEECLGLMDCKALKDNMPFDLAYQMSRRHFTPEYRDGWLLYFRCRKPA